MAATGVTSLRPSTADEPLAVHKSGTGRILLRCLKYLRSYWPLVAGGYLCLLVINGLALVMPQFIRWIVDRGIRDQDAHLLTHSVLALLGLALIKGGLTFVEGRWVEMASQNVAYELRNAIHRKLSSLSFSYHDRTETGQLLSRTIEDVERIRFLTGRALLRVAEASTLFLGTTCALMLMNPHLAALALITTPLLGYRALVFGRHYRPLSLEIQQQLAVLTTRLEQNLRGARVIKAFAQEAAEITRFDEENDRWFGLATQIARLQAVNLPMMDLIANGGLVFVIWYGGRLVIRDELTLGELVAFSTYMAQLVQPIRRLGFVVSAVAQAAASGERIFEILDAESQVRDAPNAHPLPRSNGHIRFEEVSFAYFSHHQVLDNISFEAKPGQVIALLGATASGKSSIINLIPRFYDPTSGRIMVDGHDIRSVTLNSLRDQVGIVLQETTLFAATIRENIIFGRPDASTDEIIAAAQAAQAHSFIAQMPQGYDTPVGERGVTLSGGQKQRIAIARALLKDPRILILDDATSSVDTETEQMIQQALAHLMRGRTAFIIAHRLSTVRAADLILVLDRGRIAAQGTHKELLRTSGLYADIYYRQLRPQEVTGGHVR
jgi:ABC-type multidrug transport system fused ATPase/permease subunit